MRENMGKTAHGNDAKASPDRRVPGSNITNPVTQPAEKKGSSARIDEINAEMARNFSMENEK